MTDESVPPNDSLVPRLRMELEDLLARLRGDLEGKTANSPEAWKLLRDATEVVRQSQAALRLATIEIERLHAELARRKPPDDHGLPEMVPVEPPNRPRGGSPAFATRVDDGNESARGVENVVPTMPELDKAARDWWRRTATN
ncbi:MAG: hypothetical protein WA825_09275 [Steroidobacteraceae bacterium]